MRIFSLAIIAGGLILSGCQKLPALNNLAPPPPSPSPAPIVQIQINGYSPASGNSFKDIFVSNFSVSLHQGQLSYSTSRDGLSDTYKNTLAPTYGFSTASPTSNASGLGDLLILLMGVTPAYQSQMSCPPSLNQSKSGDLIIYQDSRLPQGAQTTYLGLRDCEKMLIGLNPSTFDYDGDGIPDYLELRCGLNPKNKNDANLSTSSDSLTNYEKCKNHIPIDENSKSQNNTNYAYQYNAQKNGDGTFNFTVSNINILNDGQDNFIAIYITESNLAQTQPIAIRTGYSILNSGSSSRNFKATYWGAIPSSEVSFQ